MKCYFPIPSSSIKNQRFRLGLENPSHQQKSTLQQLREQNELLKQRISMLMKTRDHNQPRKANNALANHQQDVIFNSEDLVQQNYLSKMSKLKAGRSCSKKSNSRNVTTPSSPNKANQQFDFVQRKPFVPIPPNRQNLKVMIVQRDYNGKFYRDRQSEEKVKTSRMKSPQFQTNLIQPVQIQNTFVRTLSKDFPRPRGHQRSDTVPITENVNNGDVTKRIIPRSTITNANICQFYEKGRQIVQQNSKPSSFKKIVNKQPILKFSSKEQENGQFLKVKILSPRGAAAYIDQLQASTKVNIKKSTEQHHLSNLQSTLSIEKGMNETNRTRKLRYDIYLDDDKTN